MVDKQVVNDFMNEIEAVNDRREELREELNAINSRAKAAGVDVKILNQIVKFRKMKQTEFCAYKTTLDQYMADVGMI